jgi:hypothetical protein
MAYIDYSGTSSGSYGLNSTRTVSVSGSAVTNAKATGLLQVLVYCSCNAYNQSYNVIATVNGYSGTASGKLFDSSNYTGTYITINITVPDSFNVNGISQFSVYDSSSNSSKIFIKGNTHHVYAYYNVPTACGAPNYVAVAGVYNDAYLHEGNQTTLSWSDAWPGNYNAITGYIVYKNGSYYTTISTPYTYGSCVVYAPNAGENDSYTIVTIGTVSGLNSGESTARRLYGYGYVSAPTSIELTNDTPDAGANTTLRWSGAQNGGNNNIASYIVYRKAPSDTSWTELTTSTTTSATVTAPNTMGAQYEYCVAAVGARGDTSAQSSAVTLTAKVYTTDPPGDIMLSVEKWTSGTVRLSWTAATCTSGSSISKYYIQQRIKNYGEDFGAWADLTNVTGTSYTFTPTLTAGQTAQYRVRALSNKNVYSNYAESSNELYRPFPPTAPAGVTASPVIYNSGEVLISWPASTVTGGDVTRYYIEYARNTGNGFGDWQSLANTGNDWYSYEPSSLKAGYILKYRVRALSTDGLYGDYATSNEIHKASNPTAPTTFSVSPTAYNDGNITLSWSGAADADGDIVGYRIEYNTSKNNTSWNGWNELVSINSTAASGNYVNTPEGFDRGTYRKYRICTIDSLQLTSPYKESATVYRGLAPSAPVITAPSAGVYEMLTTLSWNASTPPDSYPISGYQVQYSINGGQSWTQLATVTNGLSVDVSTVFNSLKRGDSVLFRVRAYNTVNIYGDYAATGVIQRNRVPATPVILLPYNGAETFSKSPIILIKAPAEPDAQTHTLQYKVGNAEWNDVSGYVNMPGDIFYCVFRAPTYGDGVTALCSNNPAILKESNDKILIVSKNETLSFRLVDSLGATGDAVSILIKMLPFEFTDPTLIVGTTPIKAAHVNELRTFIDKTLTYYSATAFNWGETIVAHYTSLRLFKNHVEDMRTAISRALAKLNGTEAGKIIATPTYTDLSDYKPRASALEELRNIINNI